LIVKYRLIFDKVFGTFNERALANLINRFDRILVKFDFQVLNDTFDLGHRDTLLAYELCNYVAAYIYEIFRTSFILFFQHIEGDERWIFCILGKIV
jgi:hypothetical protein